MDQETAQVKKPGPNKELARISDWLWKIVIGILIATLPELANKYASRVFATLIHAVGLHLAQIVVSIGVISAGILGHWFKRKNQRWYGFVEVVFGSASGIVIGFTMFAGQPLLTQWVTLVGCAYVISRGLNNMSEAKAKAIRAEA
jgi:hypothetical protein